MLRSINGLTVPQIIELLENAHEEDKFSYRDRRTIYEMAMDKGYAALPDDKFGALLWGPVALARTIKKRGIEEAAAAAVALHLES